MIDPVTGNVIPNGMQDVRALGMTQNVNPFLGASAAQARPMPPVMEPLSPVPAGAQSLGAPSVPATMPGLPGDMMAATGAQMPVTGAAAPSPFGGRIPQGLLGALLRLSQRNPAMFDRRMESPMAQRFGITPEMVQGFVPPAQRQPGFGRGPDGNPGGALSMIGLAQGGGMPGFAAPAQGRDAGFAAQSQLGMDNGKAKNQNIGSTPAY